MKPPIKDFALKIHPSGDITQWFGENPVLYMTAMGLKGHNGVDIVAPHGEPLYAVEDGIVLSVKNDATGFGKHLRFISKEKNKDGYYHEWTYGHNSLNLVQQGEEVKAGQHIANMGNTGFVVSGATPYWKTNPYAGTHLHLGLRELRKTRTGWAYPGSDIKVEVRTYSNGYKGAIDPEPLLPESEVDETKRRALLLTIISLQRTLLALLKK
jgi:murein DD-endopeptidase MepM/ murein hydrolase activator NlpD